MNKSLSREWNHNSMILLLKWAMMVKSKSEMLVIHGKNASLLKGRIMENRNKKIFRKRVESESDKKETDQSIDIAHCGYQFG